MDAGAHGAPTRVDLSTPDVGVAMRFYRDLLGWAFERHDTPMTPARAYDIAKAGAAEVGGTIIRPATEIGTGDRFAVASDPTGASFQLMQPAG